MSAQILTLLKFGLLALLYLFFVRVLFSVWSELRPTGKVQGQGSPLAEPAPAEARRVTATPGPAAASVAAASDGGAPISVQSRTVVAAPGEAGAAAPPFAAAPAPADSLGDPFASVSGKLLVIEPENLAGMVYDLGAELTVGRAPGCAVVLDDTFVSSLHARIYRRERVFVLEDLGSTNGTFLNGVQVTEPTVMQRADRVRFGSMVMELQ